MEFGFSSSSNRSPLWQNASEELSRDPLEMDFSSAIGREISKVVDITRDIMSQKSDETNTQGIESRLFKIEAEQGGVKKTLSHLFNSFNSLSIVGHELSHLVIQSWRVGSSQFRS